MKRAILTLLTLVLMGAAAFPPQKFDYGPGAWLEKYVFGPYAFRRGALPTNTSVALSAVDVRTLTKMVSIRSNSSSAFYHGLRISFRGDPNSMVLYVNRVCCTLAATTAARVRSFPAHTTLVRVNGPVVVAGVSIGTPREIVYRHFGYAPLIHGQLRYEQIPKAVGNRDPRCATRYTFTFKDGRVIAMDFDHEC